MRTVQMEKATMLGNDVVPARASWPKLASRDGAAEKFLDVSPLRHHDEDSERHCREG